MINKDDPRIKQAMDTFDLLFRTYGQWPNDLEGIISDIVDLSLNLTYKDLPIFKEESLSLMLELIEAYGTKEEIEYIKDMYAKANYSILNTKRRLGIRPEKVEKKKKYATRGRPLSPDSKSGQVREYMRTYRTREELKAKLLELWPNDDRIGLRASNHLNSMRKLGRLEIHPKDKSKFRFVPS